MTEDDIFNQFKAAGIRVSTVGHLVSEVDFANSIDTTPRTVQRWREDGIGPVHTQRGGRIMYSCADIATWLASQRQTATSRDTR